MLLNENYYLFDNYRWDPTKYSEKFEKWLKEIDDPDSVITASVRHLLKGDALVELKKLESQKHASVYGKLTLC